MLTLYTPPGDLPTSWCYSIAYRSGVVALGGTYSLEFYAYNPQEGLLSPNPFRRYTLETAPGVLQVALGDWQIDPGDPNDPQDDKSYLPYAYTQFTGGVVYAWLYRSGFSCEYVCGEDESGPIGWSTGDVSPYPDDPWAANPGDFGNCCVDDADLLEVLFNFGIEYNYNDSQQFKPGRGDVNCDGRVDDADLLIVLFNFGRGCGE